MCRCVLVGDLRIGGISVDAGVAEASVGVRQAQADTDRYWSLEFTASTNSYTAYHITLQTAVAVLSRC